MGKENSIDFSLLVSSGSKILDMIYKYQFESPPRKSEYLLDEKVKQAILEDASISLDNRLALIYGYAELKKKYKRRKDVFELANTYFNRGSAAFCEKVQELDDDWFDFFTEKVENSSGEKFKDLWAKLLATHLNNQGSDKSLQYQKNLFLLSAFYQKKILLHFIRFAV